MLKFNPESFCTQPWSNIEITTTGDYKICCLAHSFTDDGTATDENGNTMNVLTHSVAEAMNSVRHKEHRLQYSRNEKPERCTNCYHKETVNNGIGSVRAGRNNMKEYIPEIVSYDEASMLTATDGSVNNLPVALDIRFGNLCNMKCIMCSPYHSSLWYEDWGKLHNTTEFKHGTNKQAKVYNIVQDQHGRFGDNIDEWWKSDTWWKRFEEIAPNLRSIYAEGGEPMLVPEHSNMLQKLIDWDYAKNIVLEYDTNLSVLNPKIINKFKHFKQIDMRVSVDETGDRYELVRFPGNYKTLLRNMTMARQAGIEFSKLTCCVGIATIYCPIRVNAIAKRFHTKMSYRFLYGPEGHNIAVLPKSAKLEIIETYKANTEAAGEAARGIPNYLEEHMDVDRPEKVKVFVNYMNKLDEIRGTDWKKTLPDIYSLLSRHCAHAFTNDQ